MAHGTRAAARLWVSNSMPCVQGEVHHLAECVLHSETHCRKHRAPQSEMRCRNERGARSHGARCAVRGPWRTTASRRRRLPAFRPPACWGSARTPRSGQQGSLAGGRGPPRTSPAGSHHMRLSQNVAVRARPRPKPLLLLPLQPTPYRCHCCMTAAGSAAAAAAAATATAARGRHRCCRRGCMALGVDVDVRLRGVQQQHQGNGPAAAGMLETSETSAMQHQQQQQWQASWRMGRACVPAATQTTGRRHPHTRCCRTSPPPSQSPTSELPGCSGAYISSSLPVWGRLLVPLTLPARCCRLNRGARKSMHVTIQCACYSIADHLTQWIVRSGSNEASSARCMPAYLPRPRCRSACCGWQRLEEGRSHRETSRAGIVT
jgi:hypothetical protein